MAKRSRPTFPLSSRSVVKSCQVISTGRFPEAPVPSFARENKKAMMAAATSFFRIQAMIGQTDAQARTGETKGK